MTDLHTDIEIEAEKGQRHACKDICGEREILWERQVRTSTEKSKAEIGTDADWQAAREWEKEREGRQTMHATHEPIKP